MFEFDPNEKNELQTCINHLLGASSDVERMPAAWKIAASKRSEQEKAIILVDCLEKCNGDARIAVIGGLARVDHELSRTTLRQIASNADGECSFYALRALAVQKDNYVFNRCCHDICHGGETQRLYAIIALRILNSDDARQLFEVLFHSHDLTHDERILVATILAENGSRVSERFLEDELLQLRGQRKARSKKAQNDWIQWEIEITAALAFLENTVGLSNLVELTETTSDNKRMCLQQTLTRVLGIQKGPFESWREYVHQWVGSKTIGGKT